MRRSCHMAVLLAVAVWAFPQQAASDAPAIGGVHGQDDRRLVDMSSRPWPAVGRINIKGYRSRHHCTGTLVAADKVITAAHCLVDAKTKQPFSTDRIFFLAGLERGEHKELGRGKCVSFLSVSKNATTPYKDDAALITLTENLTTAPAPVATQTFSKGTPIIHAGYTKDRPFSLAADGTCTLQSLSDGVWVTDCDTNFGASGGPVLVAEKGNLMLAAIMVGYVPDKFSLALPRNSWAELLQEHSCP